VYLFRSTIELGAEEARTFNMVVSHHACCRLCLLHRTLVPYLPQTGVSTIGMGLVTNFGGLVAMRILHGLSEAGLFPGKHYVQCTWYVRLTGLGCVYLISMYYKRYELQWRLTLFFTASIIAGAFGGVSPSNSS
jgi:hypothetical protein